MSVNVTINGITYKGINKLKEYGTTWRPSADVIDIPTKKMTITENTSSSGVDVSDVKTLVVCVAGGTSGGVEAELSGLSVTIGETTFNIDSTETDILNAVSSAKVNLITNSGTKSISLDQNDLSVVIQNQTGAIELGSNKISFSYGGTSYATTVIGASLEYITITTQGSNYSVKDHSGSTSFTVPYNSGYPSIVLIPASGYYMSGIKIIRTDVSPEVDVTSAVSTLISPSTDGSYTVRWNAFETGSKWRIEATPVQNNVTITSNNCEYSGTKIFTAGSIYALTWTADTGYEFVSPLYYFATKDGQSVSANVSASSDGTTLTMTTPTIEEGAIYTFGATATAKSTISTNSILATMKLGFAILGSSS